MKKADLVRLLDFINAGTSDERWEKLNHFIGYFSACTDDELSALDVDQSISMWHEFAS